LLAERHELGLPEFLAGLGVERHEVIVRRLEEQLFLPDPHAAAANAWIRAPRSSATVAAVARVERPDVIGAQAYIRPSHGDSPSRSRRAD
jgi:hypothetical protein